MIRIIEKEKDNLQEFASGKPVKSFVVDYWGEKILYELKVYSNGGSQYVAKTDPHVIAKRLAMKANIAFETAQKKAGIVPRQAGGWTAESFIPTASTF